MTTKAATFAPAWPPTWSGDVPTFLAWAAAAAGMAMGEWPAPGAPRYERTPYGARGAPAGGTTARPGATAGGRDDWRSRRPGLAAATRAGARDGGGAAR